MNLQPLFGCQFGTLIAVLLIAMPSVSAKADLVTDYQFNNSFSTSIGSAPDFVTVGPSGSFVTDMVGGQSRTVWSFPEVHGLRLDTSGFLSASEYTIGMLSSFNDVSSYRRILDTQGAADDFGLYNYNASNTLAFYSNSPGTEVFGTNQYVSIVLTRTNSGQVTGYLDGVQSFTFDDSVFQRATITSDLVFFRDDTTFGSENSSGEIARVQLFVTVHGF